MLRRRRSRLAQHAEVIKKVAANDKDSDVREAAAKVLAKLQAEE